MFQIPSREYRETKTKATGVHTCKLVLAETELRDPCERSEHLRDGPCTKKQLCKQDEQLKHSMDRKDSITRPVCALEDTP